MSGDASSHILGNYELLVDNLMDLSHVDFLHRKTFNTTGTHHESRHEVRDGESDAIWNTWLIPRVRRFPVLEPHFDDGDPIDQYTEMRWHAPASMALRICWMPGGAPVEQARHSIVNPHIITPETATSSHYFWSCDPDTASEAMARAVFENEDGPMIEAVQAAMGESDFWAMKPMILKGDVGAVRARRRLMRLRRTEAGEPAAYRLARATAEEQFDRATHVRAQARAREPRRTVEPPADWPRNHEVDPVLGVSERLPAIQQSSLAPVTQLTRDHRADRARRGLLEAVFECREFVTFGDRQPADEDRLIAKYPAERSYADRFEPFARRAIGDAAPIERTLPLPRNTPYDRFEQRLLAGVVAEQRGLGSAELFGDAVGAGRFITVRHEFGLCGIEDSTPHSVRVAADRGFHRRGSMLRGQYHVVSFAGRRVLTGWRYFLRRTATPLSCRFTSKRGIASSRSLSFE